MSQLDEWLHQIKEELAAHDRRHPDRPAAPFAVNQIVHKSNDRLEQDVALCVKHEVPVVITSLGARAEVNQAIQGYGGITLHDIINDRFAHKAIEKGATGLIAVAGRRGRPRRHAVAVRVDPGDSRLVRRAAASVGLDRQRRRRAGRAGRPAPTSPISASAFIATREARAPRRVTSR